MRVLGNICWLLVGNGGMEGTSGNYGSIRIYLYTCIHRDALPDPTDKH